MKKIFRAACVLLAACLLTACGAPASQSSDFFAMDTFMRITVWDKSAARAQAAVQTAEQSVNELSGALSRQTASGPLAQLNAANGEPVALDERTYAALEAAVQYAELTGGAFDPTTAPLSDLWGIGTEQAAVPDEAALTEALSHVGWQNIELLGNGRARLKNGAQVDLGGIGKGIATDAVLAGIGDQPTLAALGGNIGVSGENPSERDGLWKIGLADPDNSAAYIAVLSLPRGSVVTSGDYERYFEQDGVRYHHIFDPKTGFPVQNELRAVTVEDSCSARADAMTTALFVMGLERGLAFCAEQNIHAAFITRDHKLHLTAGLADRVTLAEGTDYEIIAHS